ncbi:hypothetical protein V7S43_000561 [Phytophthora oleae]|uniref:Cas12f1-like TNB domain-containing protein n=1 Tax=Phytophthora oleae TaxID=2107226 RepID=A0ABD3G6K8_9STRA
MASPPSSTRVRRPDEIVPDSQSFEEESQALTRRSQLNEDGVQDRSGRQWRAFARAKRAFNCATAKLNNCVEMYSSQTCGQCSGLHLKLGCRGVFECPYCGHVAGRDVNAAFNILRFVCARSLAVDSVHQ